jgi:hypothetical protein
MIHADVHAPLYRPSSKQAANVIGSTRTGENAAYTHILSVLVSPQCTHTCIHRQARRRIDIDRWSHPRTWRRFRTHTPSGLFRYRSQLSPFPPHWQHCLQIDAHSAFPRMYVESAGRRTKTKTNDRSGASIEPQSRSAGSVWVERMTPSLPTLADR